MHKRRLSTSDLAKYVYIHSRADLGPLHLALSLTNVLQYPVRVHPPPNANKVSRVVCELVFHVDVVVFLVPRRQVFVRAFLVLYLEDRLTLFVQHPKLQASFHYGLALLANLLDLLF